MPGVMTWLVVGVWWACSGGSGPFKGPIPQRPAVFEDPRLRTTGASQVHQLWRLPAARYTIAKTTLPEGFTPRSRFPVQMASRPIRKRRSTHIWHGTSPFSTQIRGRIGPPPGMKVFVGDAEIPYSSNLTGRSWRIQDDKLAVSWSTEGLEPVRVSFDRAQEVLIRRDLQSSGLEPRAFVEHEVTLDGRTRPGLLLPAPSTVSWELQLPEGARFEAWTTIAPLPLRNLASDGAYARLLIEAGGTTTEAGSRFVGPEEVFERWQVDLSRWAGQSVTLHLQTEVYGSRDFDHLFLGGPAVWGASSGEVRRIVVVGLDTTRPDHFSFFGYPRPTTPELDAVLATATVFDHAWTPAPRTRPSFRSATTGRNPLDAVGAKNIGAVFQEHGFVTSGIVANVHLQPRFGFSDGFDDWWFDGQSDAESQVDRALAFLDRYPERDAYLFLHLMDPHLLYRPASRHEQLFVTDPDPTLPDNFNRWQVYQWARRGALDERRKAHIMGLYDAELRGMSEQLGRLFDQLDRMPGRTLVVLHTDHGEEFWEHGGFEHNHTLYDDVTRGLLAFRVGPGQAQGRRIEAPATLADIGPTLFELADLTEVPETDGRSLVPLLLPDGEAPDWSDRPIGIGHLRYGHERWGVMHQGHKYVLHTGSGHEELYDLSADPAESRNLALSTDLDPWRRALAAAHHMEVGSGLRIRVELFTKDRRPFQIKLPAAPTQIGVIDPEATVEQPANQAWGEPPKNTVEDIGTLELGEDGVTLTYTPGEGASLRGILYVLSDQPLDPAQVSLSREGQGLATMNTRGLAVWRSGTDAIKIEPGTIPIPPPSEAARIRALQGETEDAGSERALLIELGYIKDDDEEP
ncbi:MAG TPA: hypothetical protein ENK18_21640 [Deltaproteobacteria bacterium]|nr:hypothetical protein [Deltaproteobacteria bacterium]